MTAGRFLALLGQLALVLLTARVFRIEALGGFDRLIPLVFGGFAVHALLPRRIRLPFFVLLSWAALGVVLGPAPAAFTVAAGLALIGLLHLPAPFALRVGLVLAAAVPLGLARVGRIPLPEGWGAAVPVLASLFLFRMTLYAYDLRFGKAPAGAWHRIAYFFLLPNACFPLFPVVDSKTFGRTYYDDEPARIYQKGVRWMARGVLQLALYRAVYYHLVPAPWEVQQFGDLVRFSVGSYLLYVRISGIFHLAVGILCLFGFNLPETHHRFLFASSFTDFWRRINIYFTNFLAKVVYYPVFTRARPLGTKPALLLSVAAVFIATTLFHAWQWFWLRGSFLVTANDALFFGVLGVLVAVTALREARSPRRKARRARTFADDLRHAFAVVGMFAFIAFFWGMWSGPSVPEWARMVAAAAPDARQAALLVAALAALAVLGAGVRWAGQRLAAGWPRGAALAGSPTAAVLVTSLVMLAAAEPAVQRALGTRAGAFTASLTEDRLSRQDEELVVHGYYEGLLEGNRIASRAWEEEEGDEDMLGPMNRSDGVERSPGLPAYTLKPSRSTDFKRYVLQTNEWGMRDRSYTREKPAGTLRIALIGASYAMGMGVGNDDVFETLMEDRMEREKPLPGWDHYQILNFAVGGYTLDDQLEILPRVLSFQPDVLLWVATPKLRGLSVTRLTEYLSQGRQEHSEVLREVERIAGIAPDEHDPRALRQVLERTEAETTSWALGRIAEEARAQGCVLVAALIPSVRGGGINAFQRQWMGLARQAGFTTLFLDDVWDDAPESEIAIGEKNDHPSPAGHRLIADRLYEDLVGPEGVLRGLAR